MINVMINVSLYKLLKIHGCKDCSLVQPFLIDQVVYGLSYPWSKEDTSRLPTDKITIWITIPSVEITRLDRIKRKDQDTAGES